MMRQKKQRTYLIKVRILPSCDWWIEPGKNSIYLSLLIRPLGAKKLELNG
jgi:hypothetical protein